MHDVISYLTAFHALAVLELLAVAAVQACSPAPRKSCRVWMVDPLSSAALTPDNSNGDFADSYDEAA